MILSLRNWCANNTFVVQKAYNYEDLVRGGAVLIVVMMQCIFN